VKVKLLSCTSRC